MHNAFLSNYRYSRVNQIFDYHSHRGHQLLDSEDVENAVMPDDLYDGYANQSPGIRLRK
jgi:hypothetical protein